MSCMVPPANQRMKEKNGKKKKKTCDFPLRQNCKQAIRIDFGPRPHSEFTYKDPLFEFLKYIFSPLFNSNTL